MKKERVIYENLTELSKEHSKAIQGVAVLFMLALHLFCRRENLPYDAKLYINNVPMIYYLGLWGDQCVALFCFCAGYASYLHQEKMDNKSYVRYSGKRVLKLLINYQLVVVLFSLMGIFIGKSNIIPGSLMKLLGKLFLFESSYNGAWWFMLIYIVLVIISPLVYKIVKNVKGVITFFIVGIIYFISYLVRFDLIVIPDFGMIINWAVVKGALLGTSLLPYIWGMLFYKYKFISKVRCVGQKFSVYTKIIFSIIVFGICIITHGIVESLIIAPIYIYVIMVILCLLTSFMIKFLLSNIFKIGTKIKEIYF